MDTRLLCVCVIVTIVNIIKGTTGGCRRGKETDIGRIGSKRGDDITE